MRDITCTRRHNLKRIVSSYPSQVAFAGAVGKTPQQIGGMLTGSKSFGSRIARELEAKLGLEPGVLDHQQDSDFVRISEIGRESERDGWFSIPLLNVEASCGYGTEAGLISIVGGIDMAPDFLRTLPGVVSPNGLHVVNAHGDSMEPTICDRAFCVVDTSQTRIMTDGIFCLMADGQLFTKRLQRNLDGSILMLSDNPRYQPQVIDKATLEQTTVIGRIVYVYNGSSL